VNRRSTKINTLLMKGVIKYSGDPVTCEH